MDVSLSKLQQRVMEAWHAAVHEVTNSWTQRRNNNEGLLHRISHTQEEHIKLNI